MARADLRTTLKKPAQSDASGIEEEVEKSPRPQKVRGSVQTVRMDETMVKALKQAAIDRNTSQQDIILSTLRRELGLA